MRLLAIVVLSISPTWAQKTISVSNAASGSSQIAPGSLLKILWSAPNGIGTPDPPVASVRLQLRDSDQLFNALVLSSLASGQILAVVPEDMPLGTANLRLVLNSTALPPGPVSVGPVSFGVFAVSGIGIGPALAQNNSCAGWPA